MGFATPWLLVLVLAIVSGQPPRDARPSAASQAETEQRLRNAIASADAPESSYFELNDLLARRGDVDGADGVILAAKRAFPASVRVQMAVVGVYNRRGDFDATIAALRAVAALQPQSAEAQHRLATFFWDKARAGDKAGPSEKLFYVRQGIEAEDRALWLNPEYADALMYKNVLLRLQADLSTNAFEKAQLIAEADELRNRVLLMQRDKQPTRVAVESPNPLPLTPFDEPFDHAVARLMPVRVGGNLAAPIKVRDVKPRYPQEALTKRVQGVVIIEVLIDQTGDVVNARVLRSIELLDSAALEAVSQWVFSPPVVNGRAVAILMPVTINFTLCCRVQPRAP